MVLKERIKNAVMNLLGWLILINIIYQVFFKK